MRRVQRRHKRLWLGWLLCALILPALSAAGCGMVPSRPAIQMPDRTVRSWQTAANIVVSNIRGEQSSFAGTWMEWSPVTQLVIAVTDEAVVPEVRARVVELGWVGYLDVRVAPCTQAELRAQREALNLALEGKPWRDTLIVAQGLGIPSSRARLYTPGAVALEKALINDGVPASSGLTPENIESVYQEKPQEPAAQGENPVP